MTITDHLLKYWWRHLLVLAVVIGLANLGLWQLRRLEERRALNRAIETGLNQPPVSLSGQPVEPDELHRRRVSVTGSFDNSADLLIRHRPFQGQPGSELVVPLRLAGSQQAVLVNRGWIPLADVAPDDRQKYEVSGPVTIEGIAYRSQARPDTWLAPTDPTPAPGQTRLDEWFRVDIPRIQQQVDYPLLPIYIEQNPDPDATHPPYREESFDLSDGPHLGYAIQWFAFALILIGTYTAFSWQEIAKSK